MNRERRAVLRGVALTGVTVGCGTSSIATAMANGVEASQQVDTSLPPGVTLFDLNEDGEYAVTVERASPEMRDDDHPEPIHVTSGGSSTVDYAASIAEPPDGTTLGDLDELSYEYYEESDDATQSGADGTSNESNTANQNGADDVSQGGTDGANAPGETFLVVETDDARHGMYLTVDDEDDRAAEQWRTVDVLARMRGDIAESGNWFEYTEVESGYEGQTFDDAIGRFGADARLVRVGIGRGNAVTPVTIDAFYDNLTVDGETSRFPVSIAKRVSNLNPF